MGKEEYVTTKMIVVPNIEDYGYNNGGGHVFNSRCLSYLKPLNSALYISNRKPKTLNQLQGR
jgi:hypothetical protein